MSTEESEEGGVVELSKDLRAASANLQKREVRYLVDTYVQLQKTRIRCGNQIKQMEKSGEPHGVVLWLKTNSEYLEGQIRATLDTYSKSVPVGQWLRSIYGIGPVLSAGLLAHTDLTIANTAGKLWSYAGLVPGQKWEKGEKRPWNASLKRLCFLVGDSFVKFHRNPKCFYGGLYAKRKAQEIEKNEQGAFAAQAMEGAKRVGKSTDAYPWYAGRVTLEEARRYYACESTKRAEHKIAFVEEGKGVPMLAPQHIDMRARRWAVKLFLAHFVEEGRKILGLPVVLPYPIAFLGHTDKINAPKGG